MEPLSGFTVKADSTGRDKDWFARDSHTTMFGQNSILNRSLSIHADSSPTSAKIACCNIVQYASRDDYLKLWKRFLDKELPVTKLDLDFPSN